jgi:hypothetical protein
MFDFPVITNVKNIYLQNVNVRKAIKTMNGKLLDLITTD